ncbi:MAG: response regulator [Vicinamibacteraceae bacterium]|nr:response regulator [Vicinamibacteraceae bacterium]
MLNLDLPRIAAPPSRAVSVALGALLVVVWGALRLFAFETTVFPLTYAIPLLIGVWTRDRLVLWGMAAVFIAFHTVKIFWIVPAGVLSPAESWANYGATCSNVIVAATAVHLIIRLRERLEIALDHVKAQAVELQAQGEELAQQNEELAEQAEELSRQSDELAQQGEELATQNEELTSQAEEIGGLNLELERREALLETLFETARASGTEHTALEQMAAAALGLFDGLAAVAVFEQSGKALWLRSLATPGGEPPIQCGAPGEPVIVSDGFVDLVLYEQRTACLNDVALRPDLALAPFATASSCQAVLCAPVRLGGEAHGAFCLYSKRIREWTEADFRLADWLAAQCGRVLETLRVQSALREADQRKSEFLATLSHELRNPLAPIGFALKLIEAGSPDRTAAVQVMRRQLRQLVRLVDDLLDATRLSSNKIQIRPTRADLVSIVEHAVESSMPDIEAARHALDVTWPAGPIWVEADTDRMVQVVSNLLNNASRYTPPGGRIGLALEEADGQAVLSVTDTGMGLDAADLERVFDMFTQVGGPGSGGLGIGLAIVRGIVELHGGCVEARSEGLGRGTEFRVVLPLVTHQPENAEAVPMPEPAAHDGCRVLVVDDNRDSAEMMSRVLELHGHRVQMAHDAETALSLVVETVPDVALLDIGLPGLDGYELARRLRDDERTRHVRLVAVTGWGAECDRTRAREAGFDAHLTKPAEPDVVLSTLGPPPRPSTA